MVSEAEILIFIGIEKGKCKHSVEPLYRFDAPDLKGVQNDLGIRPRSKSAALLLQLMPQFSVVIDFTVEADDASSALRAWQCGRRENE